MDIGASNVQDLGHVRPLKKVMKELESWLCSLSRGLVRFLEATWGGSELTATPAPENPTSGSHRAPGFIRTYPTSTHTIYKNKGFFSFKD